MRNLFLLAALGSYSAWAQLAPPLLGVSLDQDGTMRPVYGVPGNFILGEARLSGVQSLQFSGTAGVAKTADSLVALDSDGQITRTWPAPAGPSLCGFNRAGLPAVCYFRNARQWLIWSAGEPKSLDVGAIEGTILGVAPLTARRIQLVIAREDGIWLATLTPGSSDLSLDRQLAKGVAIAGLTADGKPILADGSDLVLPDPEAGDQRLTLPAPATSIDLLGAGWLRVGQPDGAPPLAIRLEARDNSVFRIPVAAPAADAHPEVQP